MQVEHIILCYRFNFLCTTVIWNMAKSKVEMQLENDAGNVKFSIAKLSTALEPKLKLSISLI